MSGADDRRALERRLEALGSQPVDAPRPEFADALLERLLASRPDTGDAPVVALHSRRRSQAVAARVAVGLSVAAAAALVLGIVTGVGRNDPGRGVTAIAPATRLRSTEVTIDGRGRLLAAGGVAAGLADGPAGLTCGEEMTFVDAAGNAYRCAAGATVPVTIEHGVIVGSTDPTIAPEPRLLQLYEPVVGADRAAPPLSWSWSAYDGPRFGSYRLVRTYRGDAAAAGPEVVAELTDRTVTTFPEAGPLLRSASYQVLALAPDGTVVGRSNLINVSVG